MLNRLCHLVIVCALSTPGFAQSGQLEVTEWMAFVPPLCNGGSSTYSVSNGSFVGINLAYCTETVRIRPGSGFGNPMGQLGISGGGIIGSTGVIIGNSVFVSTGPPSLASANLQGINVSVPGQPVLYGGVTGNVTGSISCHTIARFNVGGILNGMITAQSSWFSGNMIIEAGAVGSSGGLSLASGTVQLFESFGPFAGSVTIDAGALLALQAAGNFTGSIDVGGPIGTVEVFAGDLLGSVTSTDNIGGILVGANGRIGTVASPAEITAGNDIQQIVADEIHATIVADDNMTGLGDVSRVHARTGNLDGVLTAARITSPGGPDPVAVEIEGSLAADINIDEDGLEGQIIINAGNDSGEWIGDVSVDGVALGPVPFYEQTSDSIGGGAVGVVPFNFHAQDSSPVHRTVITSVPAEAVIEHYGPVFGDPAEPPMRVEWTNYPLLVGVPPTWTDVTDDFEFDLSDDPDALDRTITVTPAQGKAFIAQRIYRFIPEPGRLRCALVDGSPDVGYDDRDDTFPDEEAYRFTIYTFTWSSFDLNEDGNVDHLDAEHWLAEPVDLTGDGNADASDFMLLMDIIEHGAR